MRFIAAFITLAAAASQVAAQTIVEALLADPNASELVKVASSVDGVVDLLSKATAPITLFAPTNAAFEALVKSGANVEDKKLVGDILSYHVMPGTTYTPVAGNTALNTLLKPEGLESQIVIASFDGSAVDIKYRLTSAKVVKSTPVLDGKGIIHFIDAVLLPPQDIATVATAAGLTSLVSTIDTVGLLPTVAGLKNVTIFAPTDAAFAAIADVTKTLSKETIASIITLHVVPAPVFSATIVSAKKVEGVPTLLKGQTLNAAFDGKAVTVSGGGNAKPATVVVADVVFNAGVVHVIDTVLLPAADVPATTTTAAPAKPTNIAVNGAAAMAPAGVAAAAVAVAAMMF
ncbi:Stabilin-2 [Dinochytrium kinnereticum]|nr:Stabilin-2 [Dinochytrium kinnereticum]